jgi:hypothetical protein
MAIEMKQPEIMKVVPELLALAVHSNNKICWPAVTKKRMTTVGCSRLPDSRKSE